MAKIALRLDQMNRKAVIFNVAISSGDTIYYATKIDHIADFGGNTTRTVGTDGAQLTTSRVVYLDPTNSKGVDKDYLFVSEWKALPRLPLDMKATKWTIQKGDYLLSLDAESEYPTIAYDEYLTETEFRAISGTLHIASIDETIYKDGEVCLRTLTMDA